MKNLLVLFVFTTIVFTGNSQYFKWRIDSTTESTIHTLQESTDYSVWTTVKDTLNDSVTVELSFTPKPTPTPPTNPCIVFQDIFDSTALDTTDWEVTNTGAAHGLTYSIVDSNLVWSAAHTSSNLLSVANNKINTKQTFGSDSLVVVFAMSYTDNTLSLSQYELALWWDNTNRLYMGNEAATNQLFIRTKENGVNTNSSLYSHTNGSYKMIYDKVNSKISFYYWNSGWVGLSTNISLSTLVTGGLNPSISFSASDKNNRNGGDTGVLDYVYVLDCDISTETP